MSFFEYNILKNRIEKIAKLLHEKEKAISSSEYSFGKGKCFYESKETLPSYGEWESVIEIFKTKYCSEMSGIDGCQNADCPGYKNYLEYREVKEKYDCDMQKLKQFPILSLINPPKVK